jgi:hypothetical protein
LFRPQTAGSQHNNLEPTHFSRTDNTKCGYFHVATKVFQAMAVRFVRREIEGTIQ